MHQDPKQTLFLTPEKILKEIPLTQKQDEFIFLSRKRIEAILNGYDSRLLLIVGPCSIHDPEAALDYASKLQTLSRDVSDRFHIIMRAYFEKPRTTVGWKGMLYDPHLDSSYDMETGIRRVRKLLADLTEMGVPVGSEILEITTSQYYSDFLTWGCVGARTSPSPPHRQLASGLPFPIGFKNTTDGNIDNPIHAILSASIPHTFLGLNKQGMLAPIQTQGNPNCHVVLRGGRSGPNYKEENIQMCVEKCRQTKVRSRLMIDCSHDNCLKNHLLQIPAFSAIIDQVIAGNENIAGVMLESFLQAGSQSLSSPLKYGVSITDPCLDWETTERAIKEAYNRLCELPSDLKPQEVCLNYS